MTKSELLEIIANGENSGVEFKRDDLKNHDLAKELVAFLNFEGGRVLLGVEDDGSIAGLTRDNVEEWVMNVCRDKIRPVIIPFFEIIRNVERGKDVAVVRVERGFDAHSMWHNNRDYYYIRVGSQTRDPSKEELSRLFQQRGTFRADLRPVSGATLKDLDRRRLKDYFGRIRQQAIPADRDEAGWQTLLINTEIMIEEGVSLSGMLLFGKSPNRFLPQAGGLVEQALEFVRRNTPVTAVLEDGARRVEKPTYPDEVIRETVVNALIHRDYLLANTDIELAIYVDRLEIISPGRLPNGITPERMRAGTRASRNQLLKDVMRDYGYLEHMGMGVPRKIIRGMREHNGTEPDLIEENERFMLRLYTSRTTRC